MVEEMQNLNKKLEETVSFIANAELIWKKLIFVEL